jgi:hypothetical protein
MFTGEVVATVTAAATHPDGLTAEQVAEIVANEESK